MEDFKKQFFTISMLKGGNISEIINSIIYIIILEQVIIYIPLIINYIREFLNNYISNKSKTLLSKIDNIYVKKSGILIERNYGIENGNNLDEDIIADSLIDYISNIDNVRFLKYIRGYFPNHTEEFLLDEKSGTKAKLLSIKQDTNNTSQVKKIIFEIYTDKLSLSELKNYINNIVDEYKITKQNKLGNKLMFFNEIIQPIQADNYGKINYGNASKNSKFTMTNFYTEKTLNNIFGEQVELVRNRIEFFLNNKEWYNKKGIPYTFGLLLCGKPGTGKTSLIKAIAKITNRHIVNLSFHQFLTRTQLNNLFFSNKIYVENVSVPNTVDTYIIPNNKKIYVIEDIDAMSDIVLSREKKEEKKEEEHTEDPIQKMMRERNEVDLMLYGGGKGKMSEDEKERQKKFQEYGKIRSKLESDELTLSYLLNLLDGVLESPDRILIMTSNYPEKLDSALIRPGRIDLIVRFDNCNKYTIKCMMENFYDLQINTEELNNVKENVYTPAQIYQIFLKNFNNYKEALKEIST